MGDNAIGESGPNGCYRFLNAGYQEFDLSPQSIGTSRFCGDLVVVRCYRKPIPVLDTLAEDSDEEAYEDEGDKVTYDHITLADLRHALEFMTTGNTISEAVKPNRFYLRAAGQWIKAVKISCSGDMEFMKMPKYREVAIRRYHNIFDPDSQVDICNISSQMGFPLLVQKMNVDRSWFHEIKNCQVTRFDPCLNREVVFLMRNMDVSSVDGFDTVDAMKWDNGIDYTVLVARKDGKEVTTYQVEALVTYIKDVMMDYISREDPHMSGFQYHRYETHQRLVDELILSGKFKKFFEKLRAEKVKAGDASWAEAQFIGDV